MRQLSAIYQSYGSIITEEFAIQAEHSFPTEDYGNNCDALGEPFVNRCGYNGASQAFSAIYGEVQPPKPAKPESLIEFDQSDYATTMNCLGDKGYLYVPNSCKNGQKCGLHVALHGCEQTLADINSTFAEKTGFNEIADRKSVV